VVRGDSALVVHTALANARFTVLDARRDAATAVPVGAQPVPEPGNVVALLEREERRVFFDEVLLLGSSEEVAEVLESMRPFFGVRPLTGLPREAQVGSSAGASESLC
jgi:hypothetical protein